MLNEIERGSAAALIVEEEERLLARVEARVTLGDEEGETVERAEAADFDRELISLRDAMAEAKPEDLASLVEQMTRLAAIRERVGGARSLPVDVSSPYFAHMVLRQGPAAASDRRRDVLVGKRGFIDRRSNVQIVDWRNAPISQVYYRYDEGDDYEETVDGRTLAGVVEVRRNVSIHKARLRRIGSPQGTFVRDARGVWREAVGSAVPTLQGGQGSAARAPVPPPSAIARGGRGRRQGGAAGQQARSGANGKAGAGGASGKLGVHTGPVHRADKHLPEIAALIDREQFDLITSPSSGLVVLQGGAGSGKTTVALHRMAYLNFADRSRFRAGGMLFVVPSEALVRYVSSVLPALGVSGVAVTTYRAWARNTRQKLDAYGRRHRRQRAPARRKHRHERNGAGARSRAAPDPDGRKGRAGPAAPEAGDAHCRQGFRPLPPHPRRNGAAIAGQPHRYAAYRQAQPRRLDEDHGLGSSPSGHHPHAC